MKNITLENFEINLWYGFHTKDGEIFSGALISKYQAETVEGKEQKLHLYLTEDKNVDLNLEDITDYWIYETDENGLVTKVRVYDESLSDYGIQRGETITEILRKYQHNWNDYDDETREMLVDKIRLLITTDVLVDLLTAFVNTNKYYKEECEKHLKMLDNHVEFLNNYIEFKKTLEPGKGELVDTVLFEICKLKL